VSERGVDARVGPVIGRLRDEALPYWAVYGPPVEVTFELANTKADIVHGLGDVPDGYHVVWADGLVHAEPGVQWTKDLAYLRATAVYVHATVIFFTLREVRHDA